MARPSKVENMSYKELLDLQKRVQAAIEARRQQEQEQVRRKILELAKKSGLDVSELIGAKAKAPRKSKKAPAVKYRNPANPSQTWTGRGRKPKWLVEALQKGADIEKFAA